MKIEVLKLYQENILCHSHQPSSVSASFAASSLVRAPDTSAPASGALDGVAGKDAAALHKRSQGGL